MRVPFDFCRVLDEKDRAKIEEALKRHGITFLKDRPAAVKAQGRRKPARKKAPSNKHKLGAIPRTERSVSTMPQDFYKKEFFRGVNLCLWNYFFNTSQKESGYKAMVQEIETLQRAITGLSLNSKSLLMNLMKDSEIHQLRPKHQGNEQELPPSLDRWLQGHLQLQRLQRLQDRPNEFELWGSFFDLIKVACDVALVPKQEVLIKGIARKRGKPTPSPETTLIVNLMILFEETFYDQGIRATEHGGGAFDDFFSTIFTIAGIDEKADKKHHRKMIRTAKKELRAYDIEFHETKERKAASRRE